MDFVVKKDTEDKDYLLIGALVQDIKENTDWDLKRILTDEPYRNDCVYAFVSKVEEWSGFGLKDYYLHGLYEGYMWVKAKVDKPTPNVEAVLGDYGTFALALNEVFKKIVE